MSVSESARAVRKIASKVLCFPTEPWFPGRTVQQKCSLASANSKGYSRNVALHGVYDRTLVLYCWKQRKRHNIAEHTARDFLVFPSPICGNCQSCRDAVAHSTWLVSKFLRLLSGEAHSTWEKKLWTRRASTDPNQNTWPTESVGQWEVFIYSGLDLVDSGDGVNGFSGLDLVNLVD